MMMEDDDSNSEKQDMNTSETNHSLVMDANQSNTEKSNTSQDSCKAPLSMVRKAILFKNVSLSFTL